MKHLLLYLFFFIPLVSLTQTFEWLATGVNMNFEVQHAALTADKYFLVHGNGRSSYYIDGNIEIQSRIKVDTTFQVKSNIRMYPNDQELLLCFREDGTAAWYKEVSKRYFSVLGLDRNANDEFVVLCHLSGTLDYDEVRYEMGENSDEKQAAEKADLTFFELDNLFQNKTNQQFVESGYYVLTINKKQELLKCSLIQKEDDEGLDFEGIKATPQNNWIIYGTFDNELNWKGFESISKKAGGHFIFTFDANGKYLWGDLAANEGTSCCSYISNVQHIAVAPNGTVYMSGASQNNVKFSNGKTVQVKQDNPKLAKFESYVVAYDITGKMTLMKQASSNVLIQSIVANNDAFILAYKWNAHNPEAFGVEADTSQNRNLVIAAFNPKGKNLWSITEGAEYAQELVIVNKQLYCAGVAKYAVKPGRIGTYTLGKLERSYIAVYNLQGKFIRVKPLRPDYEYKAAPVFIYPVSDQEMFVAYTTFCGMSIPLKVYDKIFGNLKGYGEVGVIGKINY